MEESRKGVNGTVSSLFINVSTYFTNRSSTSTGKLLHVFHENVTVSQLDSLN